MKKLFLLLFVLGLCVSSKAQVHTYKTTQYARKYINSSGNWTKWSSWKKSNITMTIDFNGDFITIYSPKTQVYKITKCTRKFTDSSGGKQVEFAFVNQDKDKGHIRLRIGANGNSQVYIEFNNIMWVYNVKRTN